MNDTRFILKIVLVFSLCLNYHFLAMAQISRQVFYVDSFEGSDQNQGNSPERAWQSLAKVNEKVFEAGSLILFKSDGLWSGQLHPKGSGSHGQAIIIDRYGEGNLPIIDGGGIQGEGVLKLYNQSFWEINNLEITNFSNGPGDRRGVEVKAANTGLIRHIHLKNLKIHDIAGRVGNDLKAKMTAGIYISVTEDDIIPTRYDDVLIEGCEIYNVQNQGIVTNNEVNHSDYPGSEDWHKRKFTNLRVRDNVIHHISKNAMIIRLAEGGTVEHNLCYETALGITGNTIFSRSSRNTVFQFNEGFSNKSIDYDGSLYDPDYNSPGTIWQYSYSHDNAHGLIWICTSKEDSGLIIRHNFSKNDRGNIFYVNYPFTQARIHHNQVYIGPNRKPTLLRENPKNKHTYTFDNNTIINQSEAATIILDGGKINKQNRTLVQNLFVGMPIRDDSGLLFNFSQRINEGVIAERVFNTAINRTESVVPVRAEAMQVKELGKVNGIPFNELELQMEVRKLRAEVFAEWSKSNPRQISTGFWESEHMENGSLLVEELQRRALNKVIRRMVEQTLLVEKGLVTKESLIYADSHKKWMVNNYDREIAKSRETTIYGPITFEESQYREYLFFNQVIQLKDIMDGQEIETDSLSLTKYYESHQNLFNTRKQFSSYRENEAAVKIYLIDEKYEAWIEKIVKTAKIDLIEK